jgi:hypothetical protein
MTYQNLWPLIQNDILGALQADDFIGARPGRIVEPGDIQSVINEKLARVAAAGADGKNGVGFLVLPIERAEDSNASLPGGPLTLTIRIQWVENAILNQSANGTQTPIRVYAAWTEKILKLYTPVGLTQSLVPAHPVISEFTDNTQKNLRVGLVEFTAVEADFQPFLRVNRPQISVWSAGGSPASPSSPNSYQLAGPATVTVNAPDADPGQVFYTTDGSHPYAGNATAQIYTGPVTITQPCLFRARAFARNKAGSDTAAANFWQ